ncbi:unnamed protein product [Prunus armeniaca]
MNFWTPQSSAFKYFIPSPRSRTQYKDHSNQYCVVYWTADPGPNPAIICEEEPATNIRRTEARPKGRSGDYHYFDLAAVVCATKNFSNNNKLGEGGFGSVFKD